MDTLRAFAMGEAYRGMERMVFDWDKAARIIAERKPKYADAGLKEDWCNTSGVIYIDGKHVKDKYLYLASTWATPILNIDGEYIDCYKMESETKWNESTVWPESALKILNWDIIPEELIKADEAEETPSFTIELPLPVGQEHSMCMCSLKVKEEV